MVLFSGGRPLAILKLKKLGLVEKIVLSVGLSVSFSLFFGLMLNFASLLVGYTKPLNGWLKMPRGGHSTLIMAWGHGYWRAREKSRCLALEVHLSVITGGEVILSAISTCSTLMWLKAKPPCPAMRRWI